VRTIDLTYVGLGIHEELVAYVADQRNYYEQEGVHVALRDGCAWDGQRVRRTATIGLGRAVLSRMTDGTPWTVLCVNTHRPLFWLLARDAYSSVEELKGRRIGIHPPKTGQPPSPAHDPRRAGSCRPVCQRPHPEPQRDGGPSALRALRRTVLHRRRPPRFVRRGSGVVERGGGTGRVHGARRGRHLPHRTSRGVRVAPRGRRP
jgi:hypothetical protein